MPIPYFHSTTGLHQKSTLSYYLFALIINGLNKHIENKVVFACG